MKNYRYNFKNWFETDLEWKQTFQIKDFFPNDGLWKFSDFLPRVTFFSVFGDKNAIKKSRAKTKIFFTGEDTSQNFTDFNDHCVGDADLSIGFASEESVNAPNYIRYPLWLLYYFGEYKTLPQIQTAIDEFNSNWKLKPNKRFCALVAAHDKFGTRKRLCDILNQIQPVSCGGRLFHNDDSLVNDFSNDKETYLQNFMFNLCPENVSAPGYVTEKVFQSLAAGCIPIYYGSCGIAEEQIIDQSKIIIFNGNNDSEVLEKVRNLYQNPEEYAKMFATPPIKPEAAQWIFEKNQQLEAKLKEILKA